MRVRRLRRPGDVGTETYEYDALGLVTAGSGDGQDWAFSCVGTSDPPRPDGVSDNTWDATAPAGLGSPAPGPSGSEAPPVTEDPASGKDLMGACWYAPGSGDFTSADTVQVSADPDPAAGNPFAYAGGRGSRR